MAKKNPDDELTTLLIEVATNDTSRKEFSKNRKEFLKKFNLSKEAKAALKDGDDKALRVLIDTNQQTSKPLRDRMLGIFSKALQDDARSKGEK